MLDTYMQYLTDIVLCLEKHNVSIDTDLLFNTSDYSDMYMGIRALEGYLRLNDILSVAKSPKKIVILDTESQVLFSEVLQREISSNFGVSLGDSVHSDTSEICNLSDENNTQEQEDSTTSHSLILTDGELEDTDALELQCFQSLMSNFDENGMPIVNLDDDADDDIIQFEEYASEDWSPSTFAEDDDLDDSDDEEDDDNWEEESGESDESDEEDDFEPEEDDGDWEEESGEVVGEYTTEAEDDFEPEEDDDGWEEESDEDDELDDSDEEDNFEPEEDDDGWEEEFDEDTNNHITEPEDDFEPEEDDDDDWGEEDTSEATDDFEPEEDDDDWEEESDESADNRITEPEDDFEPEEDDDDWGEDAEDDVSEDDFEPEEDDEDDDWGSGTDDFEENTSEDDFEPEEDDDDDWGSDNFVSEDGFNSDEDDFEPEEDDDDDWGSEGQDVQTTDDTDWLEEDDDEDGDWDSPENINNSSDSFSNGLGNINSCEPEDRNVGGTTRSILNWRSGNREWERTQRGSNPYEDYDSSQDTYVDPADFIDLDEERLQETPQSNWVSRSSLNEDCSFGHDTYNNRGDTRANSEFSCEAGCSEQNFDEVLADNITNMADKAVKGLFKIGNSIKNKFRNSGNNGN